MANFSLPVIFVFFEMLLLEIIFSTSIQVSPLKGGEIPPFVVTNILLQSPWVKTPLHSHCPWMNLPNNPWASQLWVKTQFLSHCPWANFTQQLCHFWFIRKPFTPKELLPTQFISLDSAPRMSSGKLYPKSNLWLLPSAVLIAT